MWLILLDASGSMNDPFAGAKTFEGRTRETRAQRKINAAKEALLLHLKGLGQPTRTVIFAFRSTAEIVFDGSSADIAAIAAALDDVQPHNGTDIAAALAAARETIAEVRDTPIMRLLLISDGLSDSQAAEVESRRLQELHLTIDAILIDPSTEGDELVRRVVGSSGSVSAVTSAPGLESAVEGAANAIRTDIAAAAVATEKLSLARALLPAADERLSFTAAYPQEVARDGTWRSLLLFLHLESLADEARQRAKAAGLAKGADAVSATVPAATGVPRGTELELTPRLEGFEFNPSSLRVAWEEDIQQTEFRMKAKTATPGPIIGEIAICMDGLVIGRVPLSLTVQAADEAQPPSEPAISVGGVFQTVFASHARTDAAIVDACGAAYAALGIYLIIDVEALIAGQAWQPAIRALLAKSDICQLFWSSQAEASTNVAAEIDQALVLQGERGTGYIRPVFWENPHPPLPPKLSHLNFTALDLDRLRGAPTKKKRKLQAPRAPDTALAGSPSIPAVVLPLFPQISASIANEIRADAAFAADFVERTVGGRYYPVPTLLVDRQTVLVARAAETQDIDALSPELSEALTDWSDVLRAICLAIHVRRFWDGRWDGLFLQTTRSIGLNRPVAEAFFNICEAGPDHWLRPRSRPQDARMYAAGARAPLESSDYWTSDYGRLLKLGFPGLRAEMNFVEFADLFFATAARLLRERIRESGDDPVEIGFTLPMRAWRRFEQAKIAPKITMTVRPDPFTAAPSSEVAMNGTISGFADAMDGAWTAARNILRRMSGSEPAAFFLAEAPTYGIFTPQGSWTIDPQLEKKAKAWGVPPALLLPGTGRVLLCADALDDFRAASRDAGFDGTAARHFLRSVLVHEHFHAFAQMAPMDDGTAPRGSGLGDHWRNAAPVNEALAAWMEMHLARGAPALERRIRDYVESGPYPAWPYAGALIIEAEFAAKGLAVVRTLIGLLRSDPPKALAWMSANISTQPLRQRRRQK